MFTHRKRACFVLQKAVKRGAKACQPANGKPNKGGKRAALGCAFSYFGKKQRHSCFDTMTTEARATASSCQRRQAPRRRPDMPQRGLTCAQALPCARFRDTSLWRTAAWCAASRANGRLQTVADGRSRACPPRAASSPRPCASARGRGL